MHIHHGILSGQVESAPKKGGGGTMVHVKTGSSSLGLHASHMHFCMCNELTIKI